MAKETNTEATTDNTEQAAETSTILSQEAATETNAEATEAGEVKSPLATEKKAEEKVVEKTEETEKSEETEEKVEPIVYEAFTLPEGFEIDQLMQDSVLPLFAKHGIKQEDAQEIVNAYSEIQKQQVEAAQVVQKETLDKTVDAWKKELTSDPKHKENLALAQKGAQHLAEKIPEVAELVNDPMWGNMPAIFKISQYVGTMMETEATALNGTQGGKNTDRTLADEISPTLKT